MLQFHRCAGCASGAAASRLRACLGSAGCLRILASGFLFRAFLALLRLLLSQEPPRLRPLLSALRFRARHSHRSRSLELLPLKSRVGEPAFPLRRQLQGAAKAMGVEDGPIACAVGVVACALLAPVAMGAADAESGIAFGTIANAGGVARSGVGVVIDFEDVPAGAT